MPESARPPALVAFCLLVLGGTAYMFSFGWVCMDSCPPDITPPALALAGALLGPGLLAAAVTAATWVRVAWSARRRVLRGAVVVAYLPLALMLVASTPGSLGEHAHVPTTADAFYGWSFGMLAVTGLTALAMAAIAWRAQRPPAVAVNERQ